MATHVGTEYAVWDKEALAILENRGSVSAREAAELSLPCNHAPTTPRERIEEDWEVRLPLAATPAGYRNQLAGGMRGAGWSGWAALPFRPWCCTVSSTGSSPRTTAGCSRPPSPAPS